MHTENEKDTFFKPHLLSDGPFCIQGLILSSYYWVEVIISLFIEKTKKTQET